MGALTTLGAGTLTLSDADMTLAAAEGTPQELFDRVTGALDAALPAGFSLHGVPPAPQESTPAPQESREDEALPRFVATRSPEGDVHLRGHLPDDHARRTVHAYARAVLGRGNTYPAIRTDDDLPDAWSVRVLAGLQALALLNDGRLTVEPGLLIVRGATGSRTAAADVSRLLLENLGEAAHYEIDVTYQEHLDPTANIPTPAQCVERITTVLNARKITFEPGSVEFTEEAADILDQIAGILPDCRHARMEISGHTDSQGRETMNLNLSQARADAVLDGLLARGVLVSNLTAQGYGETQPLDTNDTEEGRARNRRIEFRLLASETASGQGRQDAAGAEATEEYPDEQN